MLCNADPLDYQSQGLTSHRVSALEPHVSCFLKKKGMPFALPSTILPYGCTVLTCMRMTFPLERMVKLMRRESAGFQADVDMAINGDESKVMALRIRIQDSTSDIQAAKK